jgi:hypothetical protein
MQNINNKKYILIGIVDADLLDNGTRHPNLVLMKIAGYLRDHNISYKLITNNKEEHSQFSLIYVSKVFAFSKEPDFLLDDKINNKKVFKGGTGYYAEEKNIELFNQLRDQDMNRLENDPFLPGFSMAQQMPDYSLYDEFIEKEISNGKNPQQYKDYQHYSIGFLTRGCIRKCPFCVNKNIDYVYNYSKLTDFVDNNRPMIYLWDDNFLASKNWKSLLLELQATKKPFQFRQGLDIRLINEEKASLLSKSKYHGDFIFAFDLLKDKELIIRKLKIWKQHTKKTTKLYLFCGYEISDDESLINDILNLFERIEVLMKFGCLGYVMRHEDYRSHPLCNIYVQIARWCNQPQFYKKMSFKEFIDRNQYWTKTDNKCMSLKTYEEFMANFAEHTTILEYYFNMKYENMVSPKLWEV